MTTKNQRLVLASLRQGAIAVIVQEERLMEGDFTLIALHSGPASPALKAQHGKSHPSHFQDTTPETVLNALKQDFGCVAIIEGSQAELNIIYNHPEVICNRSHPKLQLANFIASQNPQLSYSLQAECANKLHMSPAPFDPFNL